MKEREDRKTREGAPHPPDRKSTIVTRILDKFSKSIVLHLAETNITPNQVTVLRFLIFVPSSFLFFSMGGWANVIIGAALVNLFNFFDYVDGDLARIKDMHSALGAKLEHILDKIGYFVIFFGVIYGTLSFTREIAPWIVSFIAFVAFSLTTFFQTKLNLDNPSSSSILKNTPKLSRWIKSIVLVDKQILKICFFWLYLITIGAIFNQLFIALCIFTITGNLRWTCMFYTSLMRTNEEELIQEGS